jgi:DNA polymerase III gamma/tau subunit
MLCQSLDSSDPEPCNECDNCKSFLSDGPGAFVERDAASQGTVDHIRAIVEELAYVLPNAKKRIYLFDEAHRMSIAAQDVLLKPLEEKKMVGMFCTTEAGKVRGPIRSRCEEYTIRKVSREDILTRMRMILEKEGVESQDDAVLIVIDHSGGHVRDVVNKLEMISQLGPVTVDNVREYLNLSSITLYYQILLSLSEPSKSIEFLDRVCEQVAPEDVAAGLAEAAMNSYRLAHRMHTDFAFVDAELAESVYKLYGDQVVRFAHWFLSSKYPSKLSLTRDIVVFSHTRDHLPTAVPPPTSETSVSVEATSVGPKAPVEPVDDYTDLERQVVNVPMPRQRRSVSSFSTERSKPRNMSPREWRQLFEHTLRKRTPVRLP